MKIVNFFLIGVPNGVKLRSVASGSRRIAKKVATFGIISFLICVIPACRQAGVAFAQTSEEITITTYYPSPYGVYNTLTLYPNDDYTPGGACFNTERGQMYYDNTANKIYVCDGSNWAGISSVVSNFDQVTGTTDFSTNGSNNWLSVPQMTGTINLTSQSSVKVSFFSVWKAGGIWIGEFRINRDSGAEYISLGAPCCNDTPGLSTAGVYIFKDLPAGSHTFSIEIRDTTGNNLRNEVATFPNRDIRRLIVEEI